MKVAQSRFGIKTSDTLLRIFARLDVFTRFEHVWPNSVSHIGVEHLLARNFRHLLSNWLEVGLIDDELGTGNRQERAVKSLTNLCSNNTATRATNTSLSLLPTLSVDTMSSLADIVASMKSVDNEEKSDAKTTANERIQLHQHIYTCPRR